MNYHFQALFVYQLDEGEMLGWECAHIEALSQQPLKELCHEMDNFFKGYKIKTVLFVSALMVFNILFE
jgi:hypothetical protein